MPYLSRGYCYSTIDEVAQNQLAMGLIPLANGFASPVSYGITTVDGIPGYVSYTYQVKPFSSVAPSNYSVLSFYPTCTTVGSVSNQELVASLDQYFLFDATVFEIIVGSVLAAYALGHSIGAVVALLKRT